jgi:exonuclease VII small subunit
MSTSAQTFSEAYRTLKQCADTVEAAAEHDLDTVIAQVEIAKQAKATCDARIQAATERLQQLLAEPA